MPDTRKRIAVLSGGRPKAQATAKDTEEERRADALWKQVEFYNQQRRAIAEQTGDSRRLLETNDALWDIDNRRLDALEPAGRSPAEVVRGCPRRGSIRPRSITSPWRSNGVQSKSCSRSLPGMRVATRASLKETRISLPAISNRPTSRSRSSVISQEVWPRGFCQGVPRRSSGL